MKTREELARGHADKVHPLALEVEIGFQAGFDAGFARAVEMLRAPGMDAMGESESAFWADWLEKQSPTPHESGETDGT